MVLVSSRVMGGVVDDVEDESDEVDTVREEELEESGGVAGVA